VAFGGKYRSIKAADMSRGPVSSGSSTCGGAIFDLRASWGIREGGGSPSWIAGDAFLKNIYSVFRSKPAAIGFDELNDVASGSP